MGNPARHASVVAGFPMITARAGASSVAEGLSAALGQFPRTLQLLGRVAVQPRWSLSLRPDVPTGKPPQQPAKRHSLDGSGAGHGRAQRRGTPHSAQQLLTAFAVE